MKARCCECGEILKRGDEVVPVYRVSHLSEPTNPHVTPRYIHLRHVLYAGTIG